MAEDTDREISEDLADEILTSYAEHEDMNAVASDVGVHTGTVGKVVKEPWEYVEDATDYGFDVDDLPDYPLEGGNGGDGGGDGDDAFQGFTAEPPPNTKEEVQDGTPPFQEMSAGDFIKWFFDQDGFGVAGAFVNRLASKCDIGDELPNENQMINIIMEGNSRVSNRFDAKMIAETYASALKRYREANGIASQTDYQRQPGAEWVEMNDGGQQPQAHGGGWEPASGGQQQGQAAPNGGRADGGQQRHDPARQPAQQNYQQSQRDDQVAEAINELKETQRSILRMIRERDQPGSGADEQAQTLKSQAEELAELQRTLENVYGGGTEADESISELRDELQSIRREVAEAEGGGGVQVSGGGEMAPLMQLAAQGDIEPEMLRVFADSMGATDPEVKKAEYEFKAEKEKMKNRQELVDGVFDNLGDVSGELAAGLMQMFGGGDGGGSDNDDDGGGGLAGAAGGGDDSPPPPGNQSLADGEIQVVGENVGGQPQPDPQPRQQRQPGPQSGQQTDDQDDEPMSPTRRRHAKDVESGDGSNGSAISGGFRGPGEADIDDEEV